MAPEPLHSRSVPAVVALAGARDRYQLPLALHEADELQSLVTDTYWPADHRLIGPLVRSVLPEHILKLRYCPGLSSRGVKLDLPALTLASWMHLTGTAQLHPRKDRLLGKAARVEALRHNAALFVYSSYAAGAFLPETEMLRRRFIFQLHPHPVVVRRLLLEELERTPAASASIYREYEVGLDENTFAMLAQEPHLANGWTVASTYTAQTLAEQGIPMDRIRVAPYGVDLTNYPVRQAAPPASSTFTVVFAGTITQRKGLSDLLDAVRMLKSQRIRLLLCGRGFVDERLLAQYPDLSPEIHVGLPTAQLVHTLQNSDVMVLPSLAEGFAHVVLETMACGVPVIATPHTCAPDVIDEGQQGFIVPIRSPELIAEKLAWALDHRQDLAQMGRAAALRAREFTWERFRSRIRSAYHTMVDDTR